MREFSIFISSPGDVAEERLIAARVIERLAHRFAERATLRPCFWEHLPLRATEHFQPQIPKPSQFDVMVMMLWSRIGTRLPSELQRPDGTRYDSGTEFEFEDALASHQGRGLPHLLVYRKTAPMMVEISSNEDRLLEISQQKRKVDQFIDRWLRGSDGSLRAAFCSFSTPAEFEEQFEQQLRGLFEEMLATPDRGEARFLAPAIEWDPRQQGSPFRGLQSFDFEHRAIYFGRTRAIAEVLEILRQQTAAGCPFVLVFGKSGVGKSSFLRAGVLPFLVEPGVIDGVGVWRRAIFEPSDSTGDLLDGLAAALLTESALPELGRAASEAELSAMLRTSPESAVPLLRRELSVLADGLQGSRPLDQPLAAGLALLIDPVEEIFTRPGTTPEERDRFIQALAVLARSRLVWVLGSMRSDFYERCAEHPGLLELQSGHGQYLLAPPTFTETARMIRLPAQLAGLQFEEDPEQGPLDEVLREAASSDPGALPLLQFTLDEIYKRSEAAQTGLLTFQTYRDLGGLHGAVRTRAEETLAQVAELLGPGLDAAFNAVFSALVGFKDDVAHRVVRLYSPLKRLADAPDRRTLVDAFIAARLFMTDIDDERQPVVTVSHETLLQHWPRLAEWIEKNQDFLRARIRVSAAAARWREENRDTAFLLSDGKPLADARELLAAHRRELDPREIDFIEKSIAHVDERRRREQRRARLVIGSVTALAVLAGVFAAISIDKANQARVKELEAEQSLEIAEYRRIIATNSLNETAEARDESEMRADESEKLAQFLFEDIGARLQPSDPQNRRLIGLITQATLTHYANQQIETQAPATRIEQSRNLMKVARNLERMGRFREALGFGERIIGLISPIPSVDAASLGEAHHLVARCQNQLGRYDEAEKSYRHALARAATPADANRVNEDLGELFRHVGRYAESERLLAIGEGVMASVSRLRAFGELLRYQDRLPEAEQRLEAAVRLAEENATRIEKTRADLVQRRQDATAAEEIRRLDGELGLLQEKIGKAEDDRTKARSDLGVLRYDQGRLSEAEQLLRETLRENIRTKGQEHPLVAADQYKLARVLIRLEQYPEADELIRECRQSLLIALGNEPNQRMAKCLESLAALRFGQRRFDEAKQAIEEVVATRSAIFHSPHPEIWKAQEQQAEILAATGEREKAVAIRATVGATKIEHRNREAALRSLP